MKLKKLITFLVTSAMLCSTLIMGSAFSACSDKGDSSSGTEQSSTSSSSSSIEENEDIPSASDKKISLVSPKNGAAVKILDEEIKAYLATATPAEALQILETYANTNKGGISTTLSWKSNKSSFYTIYIADNEQFINAKEYMVSGFISSLEISNLIPATTYYWKVKGNKKEDVSEVRTFTTEDCGVRYITAEGGANIRDLGGWTTENGQTVNYGLLYRGNMLNGFNGGAMLTEEGINTFVNELGIKTEIDLRTIGGDNGGQTANWFGEDLQYIQAPLNQFTTILDYNSWQNLPDAQKQPVAKNADGTWRYDYTNYSVTSLKAIFDCLGDENSYPIYFHCNAGADRTGTLAFLINGLLGVEYDGLVKDFEMTSFSAYSGKRYRSHVTDGAFDDSGVYQNDENNFVAFDALYRAILENYDAGSGKLSTAIENYLTDYIGVSHETIANIKSILLKGNAPQETVVIENRQDVFLANGSVSLGDIEYDEVKSISLGGISLGTDLSNLDVAAIYDSKKQTSTIWGERELTVLVSKNGVEQRVIVPVRIITRVIKTAAEIQQMAEAREELKGYYMLGADIEVSYYGFGKKLYGTFDGNGHTLTHGWLPGHGLFGSLANGSSVKNLTVDLNYSNGPGAQYQAVFAGDCIGALIENVTINYKSGEDSTYCQYDSYNTMGFLVRGDLVNTTFRNVEINAIDEKSGEYKELGAVLGCRFGTGNVFENFVLNAAKIDSFARNKDGVALNMEDYAGVSGRIVADSVEENVMRAARKQVKIFLGERYENASVKSVYMNDVALEDYAYIDGELIFPNNEKYYLYLDKLFTVECEIGGVTIIVKANVADDAQRVILDNIEYFDMQAASNTISLSLGEDYAGYNAKYIQLGSTEMGNDMSAIDISSMKADKKLHGYNEFVVLAEKDGQMICFTVPVCLVTKYIGSLSEFTSTLTANAWTTASTVYGYYRLSRNIGSEDDALSSYSESVFDSNLAPWTGYSTLELIGFRGTFDGAGYTVSGNSKKGNWGIFGYIGKGAVIKNVTFNDYGYNGEANRGVLAQSISAATIENVTFNLYNGGGSGSGNGMSWISTWNTKNSTFKNVTFNTGDCVVGTLLGANNNEWGTKKNTFIGCKVIGTVTAIAANGTPVATVENTDGITKE